MDYCYQLIGFIFQKFNTHVHLCMHFGYLNMKFEFVYYLFGAFEEIKRLILYTTSALEASF